MIHFDPPGSIKPLTDVEPGSLVRWGEQGQHVGFCVISTADPSLRKSFVTYDPETNRFNWLYAEDSTVVSYGSDIIVSTDVGSFSPALTARTDGTLYTLDGAPHLVVAIGNDIRFLNLATGEHQSKPSWPMMGGYRCWIAGVRGLDNRLFELLSVAPTYEEASCGSVEPKSASS
jgi:hypothetical protein